MATGAVVEMGIFNYALLLALAFLALISGGCSNSADETAAAVVATSVADSPPAHTTATPRAILADQKSSPPAIEESPGQAASEYPFPDREDLFLPPSKKPPTRETRPESDETVVLMGFADVGGVRAILKIDGIITPLRVGESRGEVRVLAIDPPKVNLQRGDRQWTESLADTP
ncbi:MAG: hypothetical protein HQ581_25350 [Planctomycetes bacterium]|nr:hypothetical protein [Planctomycetota bacterium]